MRVDAEHFAEISDLVRESDLQCVPRVIDVLYHLGCFETGPDQRRVEFFVKLRQQGAACGVKLPDHRFWRGIKVPHRGTLAKKLRIVTHAKAFACLLPRGFFEYGYHD